MSTPYNTTSYIPRNQVEKMAFGLTPSCSNALYMKLGISPVSSIHAREKEDVVSVGEEIEESPFWSLSIQELKAKIEEHKEWEWECFAAPGWMRREREEMEEILQIKVEEEEMNWPIAPSYKMVKEIVEKKKAAVEMEISINKQLGCFLFKNAPEIKEYYNITMKVPSVLDKKMKAVHRMPILKCAECQRLGVWCSASCDYQAILWCAKQEAGKED